MVQGGDHRSLPSAKGLGEPLVKYQEVRPHLYKILEDPLLPLHQPGKLLAARPHSAPLVNLQLDKGQSAAVVGPFLQVKPPGVEFPLVSAKVLPQGPLVKRPELPAGFRPAKVQEASLRKQIPAPAGKTFLQQGNKH